AARGGGVLAGWALRVRRAGGRAGPPAPRCRRGPARHPAVGPAQPARPAHHVELRHAGPPAVPAPRLARAGAGTVVRVAFVPLRPGPHRPPGLTALAASPVFRTWVADLRGWSGQRLGAG